MGSLGSISSVATSRITQLWLRAEKMVQIAVVSPQEAPGSGFLQPSAA